MEGPVRKGYQMASERLGYSEREGNLAYLASDVALSIGVLFRPVPRADAWKLFRYYKFDKEMAIRQLSALGLSVEGTTSGSTAYQFYEEYKK